MNKKITKQFILINCLFLFYILFPNQTLAIWWKPTSWFEKPEPQIIERVVEKPIEKIIEKPVDRIVTKTVTVDNPDNLKRIKDLEEQLEKANDEIEKLEKQISGQSTYLTAALANLKSEYSKSYGQLTDSCIEKMQSLANQCNSYTPTYYISQPSVSDAQINATLKASCHGAWDAKTSVCYQY